MDGKKIAEYMSTLNELYEMVEKCNVFTKKKQVEDAYYDQLNQMWSNMTDEEKKTVEDLLKNGGEKK